MTTVGEPRKRILIADDDPVSCRILDTFLSKWGFDVTVATDGLQALNILERPDTPRLAVLDWMMPGMEGVQICRKIREVIGRPYIYILLLTAKNQKQDLLQGLELGADDYLTKPFDSRELRARLHVGERLLVLQDELRFQATHDGLTTIANRCAIIETLQSELSRQMRGEQHLGIILADIDHFKNVNDTHGHLCGDAVLRAVTLQMRDCLRRYDSIGRYGGEEFLIVAPGSDVAGTMGLAERIRKRIECQPVTTEQGEVSLTMSLGVAISAAPRHATAQSLLQSADDALYMAKNHGRNCCKLATSPEFASSKH